MTIQDVKTNIKWGNTIYFGAREYVCPDGFKIAVVKSDECQSKEDMDKRLIQLVEEYTGEILIRG